MLNAHHDCKCNLAQLNFGVSHINRMTAFSIFNDNLRCNLAYNEVVEKLHTYSYWTYEKLLCFILSWTPLRCVLYLCTHVICCMLMVTIQSLKPWFMWTDTKGQYLPQILEPLPLMKFYLQYIYVKDTIITWPAGWSTTYALLIVDKIEVISKKSHHWWMIHCQIIINNSWMYTQVYTVLFIVSEMHLNDYFIFLLS